MSHQIFWLFIGWATVCLTIGLFLLIITRWLR